MSHVYENINANGSTSNLEVTVNGTVTVYKVAQRGLKFTQNPNSENIYASYQYGNLENSHFVEVYETRANIPCDSLGSDGVYSNEDVGTWMADNGYKPL
jgi:phosphodiesterase/alkaline phosphatase D-like protein